MDKKNTYMTDIQWLPAEGLVKRRGEKIIRVANAVPVVVESIKIFDHRTETSRREIKIQYEISDNVRVGAPQTFTETEIVTGKFWDKRPMEVSVGDTRDTTVKKLFMWIIQRQVTEMPIKEVHIYNFGWYQKKYHWCDRSGSCVSSNEEYDAWVKMAAILREGNNAVISSVLATFHGPLKRLLLAAGIEHDFVTFLVGKSGIGKTALAKKVCGYRKQESDILALGSERKELKKTLQSANDITLVVDDFNTSESDRVTSRQLQILSEVIQMASDSGKVILDDTSTNQNDNCIHIVVTSEKIVHNLSTMNRCFLVNMDEPISKDLWKEILLMSEQNSFFIVIRSFVRYIEENYDNIVSAGRTDYDQYIRNVRQQGIFKGESANRLIETMAVQFTIKKMVVSYMKKIDIDSKLIRDLDINMSGCINKCGQELQQEIHDLDGKKEAMKYLPALSYIVSNAGNGYKFADNEEQYICGIKRGKRYVGFQKNRGYISFDTVHMCKMIRDYLNIDDVSPRSLGKELSYYHLAHVDASEAKQCCRWHTDKKYYHVSFRQLLELTAGVNEDLMFDPQSTIEDFENQRGEY